MTGACGALGQALRSILRRQGEDIIEVDLHGEETKSYLRCDVTQRDALEALLVMHRPTVVAHLAATFTEDLDVAYTLNVLSSRFILETVAKHNLATRVLLIGSAAAYGYVTPQDNPLPVTHRLAPVSTYGLTKAWQSQLVPFFATQGLDVVEARIFNLKGPGLSPLLFVGRVQRQIEDVLARRAQIISVGPLGSIRDYVSTQEAATQLLAIGAGGRSGQVYHVASGKPVCMADLLGAMLADHGLDTSIVQSSEALPANKKVDVPMVYADMTTTIPLLNRDQCTAAFNEAL